MNYNKIYDSIIRNRKAAPLNGEYSEVHHVIPRSLGGTDEPDNLVTLSPREHFVCHYLLTKMYTKHTFEWYKVNHAFMMMKCSSVNQTRYFNSRLYSSLKENFSEVMRYLNSGSKNPNYGKMWIHNIFSKENVLILKESDIPKGWVKGRYKDQRVKKCRGCGEEFPEYKKNYCSRNCIPKKKLSTTSRAKQGKRCVAAGVEYPAVSIAADAIGIGHETMRMRIKSPNFKDYYYIE